MIILRISCKTPGVEFNAQGFLDIIKGKSAEVNKVLWDMKQAVKHLGVEIIVEGE